MSLSGWYALDIFFVILCCYFIIRGCFRGFASEAISLVGFFAAMYVSFNYASLLGSILGHAFGVKEGVSSVLAIILLWLAMSLLVGLARRAMSGFLSALSLGGIDKMLGSVAGVIKTLVVVYVFFIGGLLLSPVVEPLWMSESDVLVHAGRNWPKVREALIGFHILPNETALPDKTLEQILRPYRNGSKGPKVLVRSGEGSFSL